MLFNTKDRSDGRTEEQKSHKIYRKQIITWKSQILHFSIYIKQYDQKEEVGRMGIKL